MKLQERSRQNWTAISKSLFVIGIFAQVAILLAILGSYFGLNPVVQAEAAGQFGPFTVRKAPITIEKPTVIHKYDGQKPMWSTMSPIWVAEDVAAPDVEDKDTIISLASMSEDAYKPGPEDPEWMDVDENYNSSVPFGWDDSGIRGHVFSDDTNSTIILSVKACDDFNSSTNIVHKDSY
ncbi:putative lipase atg15 [Neodidymelliopsis sp. IMI 364377]|nr:putative lipase atg15 [Neodidymelliopsis sp. IMI 364377]